MATKATTGKTTKATTKTAAKSTKNKNQAQSQAPTIKKNELSGYNVFKTADKTIINFSHKPSEECLVAVKKKFPEAKYYLPNGVEV